MSGDNADVTEDHPEALTLKGVLTLAVDPRTIAA